MMSVNFFCAICLKKCRLLIRFYDAGDVAMTQIHAVASRFVELVVPARANVWFYESAALPTELERRAGEI